MVNYYLCTFFKNIGFIDDEGEQQSNILHKFIGYTVKLLVF